MLPPPPSSTLFPYTTLFRSLERVVQREPSFSQAHYLLGTAYRALAKPDLATGQLAPGMHPTSVRIPDAWSADRKSTRLNSSHRCISYAVFCLKKKNTPSQIQ